MSTQDKVAVVTGAGTGIGKAAAVALVNDGWRVVFAGRRLEPLQQAVVEATGGNHPQVGAARPPRVPSRCPTDVTKPDSVQRAVRTNARKPSAAWTCCSTTPASARRPCPSKT